MWYRKREHCGILILLLCASVLVSASHSAFCLCTGSSFCPQKGVMWDLAQKQEELPGPGTHHSLTLSLVLGGSPG